MKIAVMGTGALGCLLGAYLSDAGDVIVLGHWPEQVAAIREHGLLVEHPDGRRSFHTPRFTDNPADAGQVDIAFVVVKSRQTLDAARTIADILKPDGLAITLQNGLNNCATLRGIIGESRVTLGITSEGATILSVAAVRHAGRGQTYFGRDVMLGETQLARLPRVVDLFNDAGFEAYLVDNTDGLLWGKLAVNAAINPLTALLQVPNGFLVDYKPLVEIMVQAAGEVAALAEAQDIVLPYPDAAKRAIAIARATATNHSSMLQDVARGAPTEIEAICGAIARIGRTLGIATPTNVLLYRLIRQIETNNRPLLQPGDVDGLLNLFELEKKLKDDESYLRN